MPVCPDCQGSRVQKTGDETVACASCHATGWVDDVAPIPPASPSPEKSVRNDRTESPRRAEGWLGLLVILGVLGLVLNQQWLSKRADNVESPQVPDPVQTTPQTDEPAAMPRKDVGNSAVSQKPSPAPMQVVYMVTHKHRLRDCHGRLTFTRKGLRFESDEPEDSFDVGLDDVTIEGDVLRIRDKPWRFEFDDGVRVERVFTDWKAGNLRPVSAP